jgi:hypothetical protein
MDTTLPRSMEVTRVDNGWVVTPNRSLMDQRPLAFSDHVWVFNDDLELFSFIAKIGEEYPEVYLNGPD